MASATPPRTPCWHCKHMISVEPRSSIVRCGRESASSMATFSRGGRYGCDQWEREPGIDDDDWDPDGTPVIGAYTPDAALQPRARSRGNDGWWTEPPRPRRPSRPVEVVPVLVPALDPFGGMFNWDDDG